MHSIETIISMIENDAKKHDYLNYKEPKIHTSIIYHDKCSDGLMAAAVAATYFKYDSGIEYIGGKHGDAPPDVTGKAVYFLDFSYKKNVVQEMLKTAREIILIDHHKSALEDLQELIDNKSIKAYTDLNRSGCSLAWDYFYPSKDKPLIVKYIEDRDLWKFKLENTKDICKGLDLEPLTFLSYVSILEEELNSHTQPYLDQINRLREAGNVLNQAYNIQCDEIIKSALRYVDLFEYKNIPIVNCNYLYASTIGNTLAEYPDVPFAITYYDSEQGRKFSLRSLTSKEDVSIIANRINSNGGGHYCAAGCMLSYDELKGHPLGI